MSEIGNLRQNYEIIFKEKLYLKGQLPQNLLRVVFFVTQLSMS